MKEATEKGVANVARYYYHKTVFVYDKADDIRGNIQGGVDITEARNYRLQRSVLPPRTITIRAPRKGQSSSAISTKRSSSQTNAPLLLNKRSYSTSLTKASSNALPNQVHQRTIVRDYGMPIYKASSRSALLAALEGYIEGHESLHRAGFLYQDISINNLIINEDDNNPS